MSVDDLRRREDAGPFPTLLDLFPVVCGATSTYCHARLFFTEQHTRDQSTWLSDFSKVILSVSNPVNAPSTHR